MGSLLKGPFRADPEPMTSKKKLSTRIAEFCVTLSVGMFFAVITLGALGILVVLVVGGFIRAWNWAF